MFKFVRVQPGEFTMGSKAYKGFPVIRHKITRPFLLSDTHVTQGQWFEVMGNRPWQTFKLKNEAMRPHTQDNHPAVCISRDDALSFCQKAGSKLGIQLDLPSDAEWEYACRAGTSTQFWWGDNADDGEPCCVAIWDLDLDPMEARPAPVRSKRPNPWGLFDMPGNVFEWTRDRIQCRRSGPYLSLDEFPDEPVNHVFKSGDCAIARGGSYSDMSSGLESARRIIRKGISGETDVGFRVCSHE